MEAIVVGEGISVNMVGTTNAQIGLWCQEVEDQLTHQHTGHPVRADDCSSIDMAVAVLD